MSVERFLSASAVERFSITIRHASCNCIAISGTR
jgi:hypothetical protein